MRKGNLASVRIFVEACFHCPIRVLVLTGCTSDTPYNSDTPSNPGCTNEITDMVFAAENLVKVEAAFISIIQRPLKGQSHYFWAR